MDQEAVLKQQRQFASTVKLSKWVVWTLIVLLIVDVASIASQYAEAGLLNTVASGEVATLAEAAIAFALAIALLVWITVQGFIQVALNLAAGIVFLMWVYRANRNLPWLTGIDPRFTPGWAVGWFFVPIFCVFRPYQVLSEIAKSSDPRAPTSSKVIGWWWALSLASSFIAMYAAQKMLRVQSTMPPVGEPLTGVQLAEFLSSTYAYMVSDAADIVLTIVTIFMVRGISQFQQAKYMGISSDLLIEREGMQN